MAIPPPKVSGPPKPASSMRTRSTLGASSGALGAGMMVQSPTDSSSVRPIVPPNWRSGIGSTVRSGANLPIASARASFSALMPSSSVWTTDFATEPPSACSTREPLLVVEDGDDRGGAGRQVLADPVVQLGLELVVGELARSRRRRRRRPPSRPAAAARRGRRPGPTPPPHPAPVRPRWSPVCRTATLPSSSCVTRMAASIATYFARPGRSGRRSQRSRCRPSGIRRRAHRSAFGTWRAPRCAGTLIQRG